MSGIAKILFPTTDPTPIFEHFRGMYATELLTAAASHFCVFKCLEKTDLTFESLREAIGLARRPARVLFTALQAMGLLETKLEKYRLTALAREHLIAGAEFDVGGYIALAAQSPGVLEMAERLRTNRPANEDAPSGAAFIYRDGLKSAMEQSDSARHFTLSLAGRARNVAPHLAERVDLSTATHVLDLAGGSGIYLYALLRKFPHLRGTVFDRPEVLAIAREEAARYETCDRASFAAGDMFADPYPACDVILLSNVLHDWDEPECEELLHRCFASLPSGGRVLIHDVFLSDALDGPLPIALYSAALFTLTQGRAYSAREYREMLSRTGFTASDEIRSTLVHCGVLEAKKA